MRERDVEMMNLLLFATGLLFIILGVTKTTGLREFPEVNRGVSLLFFIYGLALVTFTLMLFNASHPYATLINENVTVINNYEPFNETTFTFDNASVLTGQQNTSVQIWVNQTKTLEYNYSTEGSEIVNGFFTMNLVVLFLYLAVFAIMFLRKVFISSGRLRNNDEDFDE